MSNSPRVDSERSRNLARLQPARNGRVDALCEAPEDMAEAALPYWHAFVDELSEHGYLRESDGVWLRRLAETLAESDRLQSAMAQELAGSLAYSRIAVNVDRLEKRALAISTAHHLTPAARVRTGVAAPKATLLSHFED
jgi:hypothetical protein